MQQPAYNPQGVQRVHHTYVWLGGIKTSAAILVAIIAGFGSEIIKFLVKGDFYGLGMGPLLIVLGVLVLVVVALVLGFAIHFFSWKHLGYELGPTEFTYRSGIFSKKRVHVPYGRVQSVDQTASLLQRAAGVCTIEVDTAGGSANKALKVPYITASTAQQLRTELFRRKAVIMAGGTIDEQGVARDAKGNEYGSVAMEQPGVVGPNANVLDGVDAALRGVHGVFDQEQFMAQQAPSFEMGLTDKELFLAGASGSSSIAAGLILGVLGLIGTVCGFAEYFADAIEGAFDGALAMATSMTPATIGILVLVFAAIFIGMTVVMEILSVVATILGYGGFKVRRRGNRVEVERGILSRTFNGIDVDRIQAVYVRQGWIRRMFGYAQVSLGRIDSVAGDDKKNGGAAQAAAGVCVHPFIKLDQVPAFLAALVPEIPFDCQPELVRPPACAKRRAVLRNALWQNGGFWFLIGGVVAVVSAVVSISLSMGPDAVYINGLIIRGGIIYGVFMLVDMAIGAVRGLRWYKDSGIVYGGKFMTMVNGGWRREFTVVPRNKVQFSFLKANPFQRRKQVSTVVATTAAGIGSTEQKVYDLTNEDASAWTEWLRPRA